VSKFVRSAVLAAAIAGLVSAAGTSMTAAQDKKKDAKVVTKEDIAGSIVLSKDTKGMYRFKVVGADDKTIMQSSKGYEKKDDALKALDTVKGILGKAKVTEVKDADDDKKDVKKKEPEKK
jgi:uncharacterized protein YegP (UPF0339 family)